MLFTCRRTYSGGRGETHMTMLFVHSKICACCTSICFSMLCHVDEIVPPDVPPIPSSVNLGSTAAIATVIPARLIGITPTAIRGASAHTTEVGSARGCDAAATVSSTTTWQVCPWCQTH